MTKREYCKENPPIGGWCLSNTMSVILHGIEHGIDDYAYVSAGDSYSKLKIHTAPNGDSYIMFGKLKLFFAECMAV